MFTLGSPAQGVRYTSCEPGPPTGSPKKCRHTDARSSNDTDAGAHRICSTFLSILLMVIVLLVVPDWKEVGGPRPRCSSRCSPLPGPGGLCVNHRAAHRHLAECGGRICGHHPIQRAGRPTARTVSSTSTYLRLKTQFCGLRTWRHGRGRVAAHTGQGLSRSWWPTSESRKRETRLAHRPEGYRVHFSGLLPIALLVSAALARSSSAWA